MINAKINPRTKTIRWEEFYRPTYKLFKSKHWKRVAATTHFAARQRKMGKMETLRDAPTRVTPVLIVNPADQVGTNRSRRMPSKQIVLSVRSSLHEMSSRESIVCSNSIDLNNFDASIDWNKIDLAVMKKEVISDVKLLIVQDVGQWAGVCLSSHDIKNIADIGQSLWLGLSTRYPRSSEDLWAETEVLDKNSVDVWIQLECQAFEAREILRTAPRFPDAMKSADDRAENARVAFRWYNSFLWAEVLEFDSMNFNLMQWFEGLANSNCTISVVLGGFPKKLDTYFGIGHDILRQIVRMNGALSARIFFP